MLGCSSSTESQDSPAGMSVLNTPRAVRPLGGHSNPQPREWAEPESRIRCHSCLVLLQMLQLDTNHVLHAIALSENSGALVLDIAFAMPECHEKLLTVILPSVDVGQDNLHQLTGE